MTVMTAERFPQAMAALDVGNAKRTRKAHLRRKLKTGAWTIVDVMRNPPDDLAYMPLLDVIRLCRGQGIETVIRLNALAVTNRINLAVPLGRAPVSARQFVVRHMRGYDPGPAERESWAPSGEADDRPWRVRSGEYVFNADLRERFLNSGMAWTEVCRTLGMGDDQRRLRRVLGVGDSGQATIRRDLAARIAFVINADPHEVGL